MRFDELLNTLQELRSQVSDPWTISEILRSAYGDRLLSLGVGKVAFVEPGRLIVHVQGTLDNAPKLAAVEFFSRFFIIDLNWLLGKDRRASDSEGQICQRAVEAYEPEGDGAFLWIVPDGFMAELTARERQWAAEGGGYFSHESMCVLNTSNKPTRCTLEVFYESDTSRNFSHDFKVGARQSVHYRLDKMLHPDGRPMILKNEPVAYRITSHDTRVVVQGSRILTSGENSEFGSFGTVVAWTPQGK